MAKPLGIRDPVLRNTEHDPPDHHHPVDDRVEYSTTIVQGVVAAGTALDGAFAVAAAEHVPHPGGGDSVVTIEDDNRTHDDIVDWDVREGPQNIVASCLLVAGVETNAVVGGEWVEVGVASSCDSWEWWTRVPAWFVWLSWLVLERVLRPLVHGPFAIFARLRREFGTGVASAHARWVAVDGLEEDHH